MNFSIIKDYIPLITTILAALLTYFFGFRKGKRDKFNVHIEENIEEILSPMLHAIKTITREENSFQREKMLKNFFQKYNRENTKLYKLPSKFLHDWYDNTEEHFYKFTKSRSKNDWENFWTLFNKFYIMIDHEYNSIRSILYSDYLWQLNLIEKNYFIRVMLEFLIPIFEAVKFIIIICFMSIVIFLVDLLQGKQLLPSYFSQLIIIVLFLSLVSYGILAILLAEYLSAKQMQKKESPFKTKLRKKFPKLLKTSDKIMIIDIEKEKRKISIPKMCDSYNIDL